jgi:hypothetical protein
VVRRGVTIRVKVMGCLALGPVARALDAPFRLTETEVAADCGNQVIRASYENEIRPSNSSV